MTFECALEPRDHHAIQSQQTSQPCDNRRQLLWPPDWHRLNNCSYHKQSTRLLLRSTQAQNLNTVALRSLHKQANHRTMGKEAVLVTYCRLWLPLCTRSLLDDICKDKTRLSMIRVKHCELQAYRKLQAWHKNVRSAQALHNTWHQEHSYASAIGLLSSETQRQDARMAKLSYQSRLCCVHCIVTNPPFAIKLCLNSRERTNPALAELEHNKAIPLESEKNTCRSRSSNSTSCFTRRTPEKEQSQHARGVLIRPCHCTACTCHAPELDVA